MQIKVSFVLSSKSMPLSEKPIKVKTAAKFYSATLKNVSSVVTCHHLLGSLFLMDIQLTVLPGLPTFIFADLISIVIVEHKS